MKKLIFLLVFMTVTVNCYGFSIRETIIRNKRPISLRNYKGGPISNLSQEDIQEAIEFGKTNKNRKNHIDLAFMYSKDEVYILICTNYYMIARYSAQQYRNYEPLDMDYVNFLAALPTFRILVYKKLGNATFDLEQGFTAFLLPISGQFALLKDEIKVKQSEENPVYDGKSPYISMVTDEIINEEIRKTMEETLKIAKEYTEHWQKQAGVNPEDLPSVHTFSKPDQIYNYSDIDDNAKFEIVIIHTERKEERIKIDFSKIK